MICESVLDDIRTMLCKLGVGYVSLNIITLGVLFYCNSTSTTNATPIINELINRKKSVVGG